MGSDRRAFPRRAVAYRLGHFGARFSVRRSTRIILSLALGAVAGAIEVLAHIYVISSTKHTALAALADAFAVATFVFLLTYVELSVVQERRLRVIRDLKTVAELNHHIRNALEMIQYAAFTSKDKTNQVIIIESIERIDRILRELYPVLENEEKSHSKTTSPQEQR